MKKLTDVIDQTALYVQFQGEFFMVNIPKEKLIELMATEQAESATGMVSMIHLPNGLDPDLFGEIPYIH